MWALVDERIRAKLRGDPRLGARIPQIEAGVADATLSPAAAADEIGALLGI